MFASGGIKYYPQKPEIWHTIMSEPEFDITAEEDHDCPWLWRCSDSRSLEHILQNRYEKFELWPLEKRFQLALRFEILPVSAFLRCLGVSSLDARLVSLKDVYGTTILHHIARRVFAYQTCRLVDEDKQNWFDFGVDMLKNGADPCCIAEVDRAYRMVPESAQSYDSITPLLETLGISWLHIEGSSSVLTQRLENWCKMIEHGGINLRDYAAMESQAWKMLRIKNCATNDPGTVLYGGKRYSLLGLDTESGLFVDTFGNCSFKLVRQHTHVVCELGRTPGAYIDNDNLPRTVNWWPNQDEKNEGIWEVIAYITTASKAIDVREHLRQAKEPFTLLVDGIQDDSGPLSLMQYRASRQRSHMRRSNSQPPNLRRREIAQTALLQSVSHPWLDSYHLCPSESRWRFGCSKFSCDGDNTVFQLFSDNYKRTAAAVRSCVQEKLHSTSAVQQSIYWKVSSFLAEIASCQDGSVPDLAPTVSRHNRGRDCPEGCSTVDLNKLKVPEALRSHHPQRFYEE
ncbi:hypothetical protein BKA67DRAFT_92594 [Truncatella angustata]|uniref:Uncharacterized protein n=1 Tax=Truncatella angustata TaxID=152316 RepID=A0A9P8UBH4_9PEZI|nr:uncharacterized protein BKA67DRAFT_92594 [Truncatella angustata]KAH6646067.1 hypothetical protein BKA67DRAFT_92594 [Truncatella angustata]